MIWNGKFHIQIASFVVYVKCTIIIILNIHHLLRKEKLRNKEKVSGKIYALA